MAARETENNAYAKLWGDKQRESWYVVVFLYWSKNGGRGRRRRKYFSFLRSALALARSLARSPMFSKRTKKNKTTSVYRLILLWS